MTVAERIDALIQECVQSSTPSGSWAMFNLDEPLDVYIKCDFSHKNNGGNEHKNTTGRIKTKIAQLLAGFSEQNTFYAMDAVEVRGLRNFLPGFEQDLAQPRFLLEG